MPSAKKWRLSIRAGRPGPPQQEALAIAIEERARADLLPRDAVEDVWERTSGCTTLALERAPRQRRAPVWQTGFVDPLKPGSLTGAAAAAAAAAAVAGGSPIPGGEEGSDRQQQQDAAGGSTCGADSAAQSAGAGGSNTASPGETKPAAAAAAAAAGPADMQVERVGPGDSAAVLLSDKAAAGVVTAITNSSSSTRDVVEVRILLDGCVFVGQLQEVGRLELARSRVPAALAPIAEAEVHEPAPPGARCALCNGTEAPGCHADQASAAPATGMSRQGLGPLMPVSMGQQQQQSQQQQQQEEGVVWVHRQCALWSPEVYPDRRSMLMHLPSAIQRGRATRCSRCGEAGASLKCAQRACCCHFHLPCARLAGCTLIAEPYTVTCPAHKPQQPEPQQQQQQQQQKVQQQQQPLPEPKLQCRTTTHTGGRLDAAAAATGTPVSAKAAAAAAAAAGRSPMDVDTVGFESDVTPTAAVAARGSWAGGSASKLGTGGAAAAAAGGGGDDEEMEAAAAVLLSGFKRARGGQSRLQRQSNNANNSSHDGQAGSGPDSLTANQGPDGGPDGVSRLDLGGSALGAAAAAAAALARCSEDGTASDASAGSLPPLTIAEDGSVVLGGTTGQPGRAGRCAVCVVQRKGKCGTESAPRRCLRRQLQQQRKQQALALAAAAAAAGLQQQQQQQEGHQLQELQQKLSKQQQQQQQQGLTDDGETPVVGEGGGSAATAFLHALAAADRAEEQAC
ncbi:hypothetical protein OEZ86_004425 [Tetradesmus obliquus]|nr:hypothetical protein OEZ86_004425 [Tetradesmus obliquus]